MKNSLAAGGAAGRNPSMNLRQIEVFRAVFMAQSISGGARQLNISQPSVSRMIHHLQRQLGYDLFELRQGRITPTSQGTALFRETNGLFERVQHVSDFAASLRTGFGERLVVLSYYSAAMKAVPKVLHAVPDASLSLDIRNPAEQVDDVLRGDADIGISGNVPELPNLEQRPLAHDEVVAVLPRDHPAAAKRTISLETIAGMPCIAGPGTSPMGKLMRQAFNERGLELNLKVAIGSPVPVFELVRLMNGVGLLGAMALKNIREDEGLVVRPLDVTVRYPVSVFWNSNAMQTRVRRLFVDLLVEEFKSRARKPRGAASGG